MLNEEKLLLIRNQAKQLRNTIAGETPPDLSFLKGFVDLVENTLLDAHATCDEYAGYKLDYERLTKGLEVLESLGHFRAQEIMPEQWSIESNRVVIGSGASLLGAAYNIKKEKEDGGSLSSLELDTLR